jgi:hypothetical protein
MNQVLVSLTVPVPLHEEDEGRWLTNEPDELVAPFPLQLMRVEQEQPKPKRSPGE